MKKRALELSGKATAAQGWGGGQRGGKEADERKSRVVRHKRNSFGDTGTSLSCSLRSLLRLPSSSHLHLSRLPWPRDPVLFYWFMGFFSRGPPSRTSERADCESPLFSLPPIRSRTLARISLRKQEKERKRASERASWGKGETIKKSKCQPP